MTNVMKIIQNVMVPVDFSEGSKEAVQFAASLAHVYDANLFVLQVKEPYPVHGRIVAGSLEDVQKHRLVKEQTELGSMFPEQFKDSVAVQEIQVTGMPVYRVIVEKARELSIDVIVIPLQDRKGWMHIFKKNITAEVMRHAPCSVLAVQTSRSKAKV